MLGGQAGVRHAPDPVTRQVASLALRDERRHVAFGVAHLKHAVDADRSMLGRLRMAACSDRV